MKPHTLLTPFFKKQEAVANLVTKIPFFPYFLPLSFFRGGEEASHAANAIPKMQEAVANLVTKITSFPYFLPFSIFGGGEETAHAADSLPQGARSRGQSRH